MSLQADVGRVLSRGRRPGTRAGDGVRTPRGSAHLYKMYLKRSRGLTLASRARGAGNSAFPCPARSRDVAVPSAARPATNIHSHATPPAPLSRAGEAVFQDQHRHQGPARRRQGAWQQGEHGPHHRAGEQSLTWRGGDGTGAKNAKNYLM
jgi:hypothetical protein